jgi:hypothetical protein
LGAVFTSIAGVFRSKAADILSEQAAARELAGD